MLSEPARGAGPSLSESQAKDGGSRPSRTVRPIRRSESGSAPPTGIPPPRHGNGVRRCCPPRSIRVEPRPGGGLPGGFVNEPPPPGGGSDAAAPLFLEVPQSADGEESENAEQSRKQHADPPFHGGGGVLRLPLDEPPLGDRQEHIDPEQPWKNHLHPPFLSAGAESPPTHVLADIRGTGPGCQADSKVDGSLCTDRGPPGLRALV
jgi:hypothetical protein